MRRAKKRAAEDGTTLTALMEDGLRRELDERDRGADKPRIMPRVSEAGRGQIAKVGLIDLGALEEQEDLERLERINRQFRDPR
jgi:hypothetical protein